MKNNMKLRLALFIAVLILAVGAFTYGVVQYGKKTEGWHEITLTADVKVDAYESGIRLYCFLEGTSNGIKHQINETQAVYSSAMGKYYRMLNADTPYDNVTNPASINAAGGNPVIADPELIGVLEDAFSKTETGGAYNLFGGALYSEWETLTYLEDPVSFDPLYHAGEAELLEEMGSMSAPEHFSLTVEDGDRIRFSVSEDYRAFAAENEITAPALDLNLLRNAYLMDLVAAELEAKGIRNGYLVCDSGLCRVLSGSAKAEYRLYAAGENTMTTAAAVLLPGGAVCCRYGILPVNEGDGGYYRAGGLFRTPYAMADAGRYNSLCLISRSGSAADLCYEMLKTLSGAKEPQADLAAYEERNGNGLMILGSEGFELYTDGEYPVYPR